MKLPHPCPCCTINDWMICCNFFQRCSPGNSTTAWVSATVISRVPFICGDTLKGAVFFAGSHWASASGNGVLYQNRLRAGTGSHQNGKAEYECLQQVSASVSRPVCS